MITAKTVRTLQVSWGTRRGVSDNLAGDDRVLGLILIPVTTNDLPARDVLVENLWREVAGLPKS